MLSDEEQDELDAAISKLQDYREQGEEIAELLQLGPSGKKAKDGEVSKAAKEVGRKWGVVIENERARKSMKFSREFTPKRMMRLIKLCQKYGHCPDSSLIVLLLPLKARDRNRLLKEAIEKRWTKSDIDAEKERLKPGGHRDPKNGGRHPKAVKSLAALTGQARLGARNWGRVINILEDEKKEAAFKLKQGQREDLKALVKLLQKISKWRG